MTLAYPKRSPTHSLETKTDLECFPHLLGLCLFARREGVETGEFEGTKIAAHSIKGSAAVFGATELSEAAKVLEHAVKVRAGASNAIFTQKQSSDHHLILLFRFSLSFGAERGYGQQGARKDG